MSSEPQSEHPGYSLDEEDPPEDPPPALLLKPERADDPVLISGASRAGDAVSSAVSSSSPIILTQPTPTPPRQEEDSTTAHTPPLPERPVVDEFADPKIAPLHAIFPDYDAAILYYVVDSVGGDEDRAVDALLAMSDPDHVPTHEATPEQPSVTEQTQLDEEFARQLLLEDEQQYARDQIAQRQQEQMRHFPYAPRTQGPPSPQGNLRGDGDDDAQQQPPQPQQQRDTMSDVQEQFSKLAETGKRTFSSFVSKVKAKVQEFDQTRNTPNPSSSGTGTSASAGYTTQPLSPGVDRHAQQAYYAPRAVPNSRPSTINDVSENITLPRSSSFSTVPATNASAVTAAADNDSAGILPPPTTNVGRPAASNIDPDKIGLLPKRPVSLANVESSQPSHAHPHDEEEEELEYVENPFEEGTYS